MKYLRTQEVMQMAGMGRHHGSRSLRNFGLKTIKRMMPVSGRGIPTHNRLTEVVTEKDAKLFLKSRGLGITKLEKEQPSKLEDLLAKKREKEGWLVIPNYKAGTPDLILLRRDKNGKLELMFEDAKSLNHGISKEQYAFAEKLRKFGIRVEFTWLDD